MAFEIEKVNGIDLFNIRQSMPKAKTTDELLLRKINQPHYPSLSFSFVLIWFILVLLVGCSLFDEWMSWWWCLPHNRIHLVMRCIYALDCIHPFGHRVGGFSLDGLRRRRSSESDWNNTRVFLISLSLPNSVKELEKKSPVRGQQASKQVDGNDQQPPLVVTLYLVSIKFKREKK